MENNLEERLKQLRPCILWIELGALLHDLGKLSKKFIEYRKSWHTHPRGWDIDPHAPNFLEKDKIYKSNTNIQQFFEKEVYSLIPSKDIYDLFKTFSISKSVNKHTDSDEDILNIIKAADGVDAATDRNNPLFSAEQCNRYLPAEAQDKIVFKSNVYGFEGEETFINMDKLDKEREDLYKQLEIKLEAFTSCFNWELRRSLFKSINKAFNTTVSDTTRPANDTTLWEHEYAVATLTKVACAHYVVYGETLDRFNKVYFAIFGVGWDGLRFITPGHKISDIVGRKQLIEDIQDETRKYIECEIPLGNFVYKDLNGIYFMIPAVKKKNSEYSELIESIKNKIREICAETSNGELYPHFHIINETKYMTQIVRAIREIKRKYRIPIGEKPDKIIEKLRDKWNPDEGNKGKKPNLLICPVCRKRPFEIRGDNICQICLKRRGQAQAAHREEQQTMFLEELADSNNRVALIVACFGLKRWLSGEMVRSLFVSPTYMMKKEVEDLGNTAQFRKEELEIKSYLQSALPASWSDYNYDRIRHEITLCQECAAAGGFPDCEYARNVLFLYTKRIESGPKSKINRNLKKWTSLWPHFLQSAREEHKEQISIDDTNLLINILLSKTPTPSTVLDTWQSTERFFEGMADEKGIPGLLKEKERPVLKVKEEDLEKDLHKGATYKGEINGDKVEVVWRGENTFWIIDREYQKDQKRWEGKKLTITESDVKSRSKAEFTIEGVESMPYLPYRVIATSPVLFLVLVPADRAVKISRFLHQQYVKYFGKVVGRLPFSIGNIFFYKKTPMFAVLDAARRMVENFEELHKTTKSFVIKSLPPAWQRTLAPQLNIKVVYEDREEITWQIPVRLGDCSVDHFHPYMIVKENRCGSDPVRRPSYLPALEGPAIHVTDLEVGDVIQAYPNYYDFEFLDTTARRYDLQMASNGEKRSHHLLGKDGIRPYFLEQLHDIQRLWQRLKTMPDLTDTGLRNIESLLQSKVSEWRVFFRKKDSGFEAYETLVDSILKKELGLDPDSEDFGFFKHALLSGMFFDCLELYLKILKERIKEE